MMNKNFDKPAIVVYKSKELNENVDLNELIWGIEEEGIPYIVKDMEDEASDSLAYEASHRSRLSVGIGIDKNESLVITHSKLPMGEGLFKVDLIHKDNNLRNLGSNAARIVKGFPLKEIK